MLEALEGDGARIVPQQTVEADAEGPAAAEAYDANDDAQLEAAETIGARILEHCVEVGGTVTGEHGVGVEKLDQMCVQFAPGELSLFHAIKAAGHSDKAAARMTRISPTTYRKWKRERGL